jgi:hypothetical protein
LWHSQDHHDNAAYTCSLGWVCAMVAWHR